MRHVLSLLKRSFTAQLVTGVFTVFLFALASVIAVYVAVKHQEADSIVINDAGKLRMLSQEIAKTAFMIALGDLTARQELDETASLFSATFDGVRYGNPERGTPPAPATLVPQLEVIDAIWKPFQKDIQTVLTASPAGPDFARAAENIKAQNLNLLTEANRAVQQFESEAQKKTHNLFILLGIFLALDFVAFAGVVLMLRRAMRPIKTLVEATHQVAAGDLSVSVAIDTENEIGELGQSFNAMLADIRASNEAVIAEKASVEQKVEQAVATAEERRRYLARHVDRMLERMEQFAQGDLTVHLESERDNDEMAQLFTGFNQAVGNIRHLFERVQHAVEATLATALEIAQATEQLAAGAQEQSAQASEVANAVDQMSRTIFENTEQVTKTTRVARQSGTVAVEGGHVVAQTVTNIRKIAERVGRSATQVESLGASSQEISEIADTIEDIAAQTGLLALNAAIEAARAGEHGRGFAVVADEVRQLAERTTQATKQISDMIESIQSKTTEAVHSMQAGTQEVETGLVLADKAGQALTRIVEETNQTVELISLIAVASEEQAATSEQISQSVESISDVSEEAARGVADIAQSTDRLNADMSQLRDLVSRFIVTQASYHGSHPTSAVDIPRKRSSLVLA